VTLILVVLAGVVNVPGLAKTCILEKPPAAAAALVQVVPLEVNTLPGDPAATKLTALVPAPIRTEPEVKVVAPVPPSATTRGVVKSIAGDVIPVVPSSVIGMFYS
jgi:hypothetical protein